MSWHYKSSSELGGLVQSGRHNHLVPFNLFTGHDIAEQLLIWR